MGNALHSTKAKAAAHAAPAGATERNVTQSRGDKRERAGSGRKRAPRVLKEGAEQQLRAGTDMLSAAVSNFATAARAGTAAAPSGGFRQAYASIVQFLPKKRRLAMLEAMRRSIDEVAREESTAAPAAQTATQPVSTADFMAGLEQQEQAKLESGAADGTLLPGREMQQRLQVSPQALSTALKRKRIFALKGSSGRYLYPAFFADPAYDRIVLEQVSQALGDLPGSAKLQFFTAPRLSLGGKSPLQALARGQLAAVLDQANAVREA